MFTKLKDLRSKKSDQGFTIIEVMIVLAIAGLILLIVFLAVPALQRASRNTSRKDDAANISAAVATYESNNSGNLPTNFGVNQNNNNYLDVCASGGVAATGVVISGTCTGNIETANLGYFTPGTVYVTAATAASHTAPTIGTTASATVVTTASAILVTNETCGGANAGAYTPRSASVWYDTETGGTGAGALQCVSN